MLHSLLNWRKHPSGEDAPTSGARLRVWMFAISIALIFAAFFYFKPDFARKSLPLKEAHATQLSMSWFGIPDLSSPAAEEKTEEHSKLEELKQTQRVASWIAKRYRIAGKASQLFVTTAYKTAFELDLDPHMILAVMAIESRFNPAAESPMGAQGLMQIMPKDHAAKFAAHGGVHRILDPEVNIKVGSKILKDYVRQKGSMMGALKCYVGAAAMSHDGGYGSRVYKEYRKLKAVAGSSSSAAAPHDAKTRKHAAGSRGHAPGSRKIIDVNKLSAESLPEA